MKRNTLKKTVAFVLAMTLVTGGMPVNVGTGGFFRENTASLTAYAANLTATDTTWSEDSTIETDVTIENSVTVNSDITLTIPDGKTLIANGGIMAGDLMTRVYHNLTVKGGGTLIVEPDKSAYIGLVGNLIVDGATVQVTGGTDGSGKGRAGIQGNVTVKSGSLTVTGGNGNNSQNQNYGGDGIVGAVTVNGGSITVTGGNGGDGPSGNGGNGGVGVRTVTVTGGSASITGGKGGNGKNTWNSNGNTVEAVSESITGNAIESTNGSDWTPVSGNSSTKQYVQVTPAHTHSFTYTLNDVGDTITATCGADGCTLNDGSGNHTATLTIAPSSTGGNTAELTGAVSNFGVTNANIQYQTKTSTDWQNMDSAPDSSATGFFKASVTVGGQTATVTYGVSTVAKGNVTNPSGKSYDFTVPTTAAVGSKIKPTPTTALDTGYEIKKITVKDENQNDVSAAVQADAEGFIMPEYNVTVDVEFGMIDYTITKNTATNGTFTVKNGENEVTTAHYGDTVTLVATPNDGYALSDLKVKDSANFTMELSGSGNTRTFTMPAKNVTVTANFREKKNTGVTLNTTGTGGTASLMKNDYSKLKSTDQVTEGDTFVLRVNKEDEYSYRTSSNAGAVSMTEFTENEYQAYIAYANENGISIPINTVLYHVTMPYVASGDLNVNVEFAKAQTFTILYQPSTQATTDVWCKFSKTEDSQEKTFTVKMDPDAKMGSKTVYSVKLSAPFNPEKVAFGTSEEALETAVMNTASVSETETWTTIADDKYLIVGGKAKTAIVSFNHDDSSEYQIVICKTDDSGNVTEAGKVTTPAAPTKEGYNFVAWRGYEGIEEVNRSANTEISVNESMVFTAVWQRNNPNIKLNLNGGTGGSNVTSVAYGQALTISGNPTRNGYEFDGWTVAKTVTEDGKLFVKGTPFDLSTNITADLELDAQWKHEHSYSCYQISQFPSLEKYQKYESAVHIAVCGCEDVELVAHEFDSNGKCACGYQIPTSDDAELEVSYGKMESGNYIAKMTELPEKKKKNQEVSVSAPSNWGSLTFSKWQYSTDGGTTWEDAGAYTMMSFAIPCDMKMRAVYVNATMKPEVSMSATTYATTAANRDELYNSILYQMNYKLPDGCTYVDSGVRAGDNAGISYYELKEKRASMDGEAKAITYGIAAAMSVLQGELTTFDTSASWQYYAKRENNVLDENDMDAEKLGEYMYLSKPINIKDEPLYWNYKPNTKSQSGSINALIPVGFAQRNNGDHYIYAIAWLRYKDKNGNVQTIYTNALPTTLNGIASCSPVSKNGN